MKNALKYTAVIASIIVVMLLFAFLIKGKEHCPVCGSTEEMTKCPICESRVCIFCADTDHYIEDLYYSGEMKSYLESRGNVVFEDWNTAFYECLSDIDAVKDVLSDYGYKVIEDG